MIPSSLGAAVSGSQQVVPAQKQATNEEFTQSAEKQLETPAAKESTAPAVPPTRGTAISLEAITAVQQANETVSDTSQVGNSNQIANNTQIENAPTPQDRATEKLAEHNEAANANDAQGSAAEAEGAQRAESRQSASTELPVGEETDTAGRSVRNPLNLQI